MGGREGEDWRAESESGVCGGGGSSGGGGGWTVWWELKEWELISGEDRTSRGWR